jgi:hypothetical protein
LLLSNFKCNLLILQHLRQHITRHKILRPPTRRIHNIQHRRKPRPHALCAVLCQRVRPGYIAPVGVPGNLVGVVPALEGFGGLAVEEEAEVVDEPAALVVESCLVDEFGLLENGSVPGVRYWTCGVKRRGLVSDTNSNRRLRRRSAVKRYHCSYLGIYVPIPDGAVW